MAAAADSKGDCLPCQLAQPCSPVSFAAAGCGHGHAHLHSPGCLLVPSFIVQRLADTSLPTCSACSCWMQPWACTTCTPARRLSSTATVRLFCPVQCAAVSQSCSVGGAAAAASLDAGNSAGSVTALCEVCLHPCGSLPVLAVMFCKVCSCVINALHRCLPHPSCPQSSRPTCW